MSGIAAMKGAHLEEDRHQALHSHPFHSTGDSVGPPVRGVLNIPLCHTSQVPPPASHPQQLLAVPWGHEDQPSMQERWEGVG